MRLFIGIKLDSKATNHLKLIMNNLKISGFTGNYTNINNIHLTILFLGEVDSTKIQSIKEVINEVSISNINNLDIKGIKLTNITNLKDMIIACVECSSALNKIYQEIYSKLSNLGFNLDKRDYYPHITLIRKTNKIIDKKICIESSFTKLTLFESTRVNDKLIYNSLN